VVQEPEVEAGVVGHEHRVAEELDQGGEDGLHGRRFPDRVVVDAGEVGDERGDGNAGIDQGVKRADSLATAVLHRPDLGDPRLGRRAAGRLQVHAGERDLVKRDPEVLEARLGHLDRPRSRRHGPHRSPPR
jgi:hypothetical protein